MSAHHSTSASAPHPLPLPDSDKFNSARVCRQSDCGLWSQFPGADAASRRIILSSRNGIYHWVRRAAYLLGHCIRVNQPGQSLHVQWAAGVWALPCCTQVLLVYFMIRLWTWLGIKMPGMCPENLQLSRHERCWLDCGFVAWDTLRNLGNKNEQMRSPTCSALIPGKLKSEAVKLLCSSSSWASLAQF